MRVSSNPKLSPEKYESPQYYYYEGGIELGFNGIIITDDMAMAAADYTEPYKTAVLAGNDMIIVTDYNTAFNEIINAVKNGEIDESIINSAVNGILTAKEERNII